MPELPEVETIRRVLKQGTPENKSLVGESIAGEQVLWTGTIAAPSPGEFCERIVGQKIDDILRRGKFLVFDLSSDYLLFHLRMSGDLWVEDVNSTNATHHRLVLDFSSGRRLAFNDTRKFGRVWLVSDSQEVLGDLGPEPLDPGFTPMQLSQILHSRRRQIKPLLMDQKILAGLGNIYTDEALHRARLHPLVRSDQINNEKAESLWASIRDTLHEGIQRNGASIDWVYRGGDFQNYFRVYQRDGKPCCECGATIERILVGQRSTHFCPNCQQLPD